MKTTAENVSNGELSILLQEYPFSSALKLLKSKRQLESASFGYLENVSMASCSASPSSVVDILFSFPEKEKEINETESKSEVEGLKKVTGTAAAAAAVGLSIQDQIQEKDQAEGLDEVEQAAEIAQEEVEDQHEKIIENDIETFQSLDSSAEMAPELNHLSDYSAWLLQLKPSVGSEKSDLSGTETDSSTSDVIDGDVKDRVTEDKSSELNKEIVSESLANLLADQGHYKKATAMYEKLSLIIPEKSAYFVAQIEKIKRK